MSSLAEKIQQEQRRKEQELQKKVVVKKARFSPGEKFLGLLFAGFMFVGAIQIVSNHSAIYQVNTGIEDIKTTISEQQKVNYDLEAEVSELSKYERILEKAKSLGLELNENNVKVVQE